MATVVRKPEEDARATVLRGVTYATYKRLASTPANDRLRMAYHDGVLEIVSPRLANHELPSERLRVLVAIVAEALGLRYQGVGGSTFRKKGDGPFKGVGQEPDRSFYFANAARLPRQGDPDLDAGDPPPDLWIEVDNRVSSAARLPIYAALGVPEVWRYRAESQKLRLFRLVGDRYEAVERSFALPILTPTLILEALALGDGLRQYESDWLLLLRDWARRLIEGRANTP